MKGNLLIAHGGGPSAVINCSLYGAVREALGSETVGAVYGALGGSAGILAQRLIDFRTVPAAELELLKQTPASSIGTSRTHLEDADYDRMVELFQKHNIRWVLFNGGNGSMDTCGKIGRAARRAGISVVGIPKTIDNDIAVTDHCPGYGSAARYIAQTVSEISMDVRSMPIHVSIVEAMGRNAGWITAAAALAKRDEAGGPHMILLPETPFEEDAFLTRVEALYKEYGGVVVVASEGLKKPGGESIVDPILTIGRSVYFGDVGAHLSTLVLKHLGYKARSEKPGIAGRASVLCQSPVDREEAILAGAEACRAALAGETDIMIGFRRVSDAPYRVETIRVPIEQVMLGERPMPAEFLAPGGGVTPAFTDWCRPLIGGELPRYAWFNQ